MPDSATPWTAAFQAPLSMRFSGQGYWSGLPFPSPGHLPNPGIDPGFPALQANSLPIELQGKLLAVLFKFYLKKFFFKFYFAILYWFSHTLTWIHHRCTRVPNPEPPSHLLPHTISLGLPSAPAPSILYLASNIDWRFISYMILYMFQCHSPK